MLLKRPAKVPEPLTDATLAVHRPVLFRYALLQLRDNTQAEDAVQETLLAALQSAAEFKGGSALRTWLIGILKHKIADYWRRCSREAIVAEMDLVNIDDSDDDDFFQSDGHWQSSPSSWNDPEAALHQQEFWAIYEVCQNSLPPKMARVFMLRELIGLEADEVCRETGLTEANYWVTMHRARLRLRECLEIRWFNQANVQKEKRDA